MQNDLHTISQLNKTISNFNVGSNIRKPDPFYTKLIYLWRNKVYDKFSYQPSLATKRNSWCVLLATVPVMIACRNDLVSSWPRSA
jgi:hypothetical protein